MKLSYLVYEPVTRAELAQRMEYVAALGYQGIELSACHPLGYSAAEIAALVEKFRLPVVSLLSGWSYSHEGLCLSRPEADVRGRAVARLTEYVELAGQLGAVVVMGLMQGLRSDEPDPAVATERIVDCLRPVAEAARQHGTQLVIEPVNHQQVGFHNSAAEVAAVVERVDSPGLGYMLDTIHMHIEERSPVQTIREHGPRIRHFHLCDSNGSPLGTGNLDFAANLSALRDSGYQNYISVKVYRKAPWHEAARGAIEFLRQYDLGKS